MLLDVTRVMMLEEGEDVVLCTYPQSGRQRTRLLVLPQSDTESGRGGGGQEEGEDNENEYHRTHTRVSSHT